MLILGGCGSRPVQVEPYEIATGSENACQAMIAALPEVVSDAIRRTPASSAPGVAVWGAPPIILRCGVADATRGLDEQLYSFQGIDWYPLAGRGGFIFTTVGRSPVVEIAVPDDYAPEVEVLVAIADAVGGATVTHPEAS